MVVYLLTLLPGFAMALAVAEAHGRERSVDLIA
jgi:hypothetical protein